MENLIGRSREQAALVAALRTVELGEGGLILLAGDAGIGKTRLAEEILGESNLLVLAAGADQQATPPYGPVVVALRAYLAAEPDGLRDCGPLTPYLALLLPELGLAPADGDRATLFEAIRCAFATIGRRQPTVVFLDDLHWADEATLDLLSALARTPGREPLILVGAYRSDEIPRGHPLRRIRTELRRAGRLREIALEPLNREGTATLAARLLGRGLGPRLAATLHDRTQGMPFFVEELAAALAASGRLRGDASAVDIEPDGEVPIPDTVRDAVLQRTDGLTEAARAAVEVAAVVGLRFDLDLVAELSSGDDGLGEAIERGFLREEGSGEGAFRHALAREAVYGDVGWSRRRELHRQIADRLQARGALPGLVAEHWLAGRDLGRARWALLTAAEQSFRVHAYRDAARAYRRALELWPNGEDEAGRLDLLDRLARSATLGGDLPEAARSWREVVDGRRLVSDLQGSAAAERSLAGVYDLQASRERALAARQAAADGFAAAGLPGDAAAERLEAARHLRFLGCFGEALGAVLTAGQEAALVQRPDLRVRALVLEGVVRAKLGELEAGIAAVQAGLALALEQNLTGSAVEAYVGLAGVLQYAGDYGRAREAYVRAFAACEARGEMETAQTCLVCLADIVARAGEWDRAIELCRDILSSPVAPADSRQEAIQVLGLIHAWRGEARRAQELLSEASAHARRHGTLIDQLVVAWALAQLDELDGRHDAARERARAVLDRWTEAGVDHQLRVASLYETGRAVGALRAMATFFSEREMTAEVRVCAKVLADLAGEANTPEGLAGLAHALGEIAVLGGDADQAASHFDRALELVRELELPFERAQTQLRAGATLAAAGQREAGVKHLTDAYRAARGLGARPLAERAAREMVALGEPVERRLGQRAATQLAHGGLSRRELEVLRLLSVGRTNREVAEELFLSARTVDMHVRNIFAKLDCRTRGEATYKARALGLLA
jgi:DNA-binding NarL/FixJ family response regulator